MAAETPGDILQKFELPGKGYEAHPLKQGLINDTFLVREGGKTRYILQRINTRVFPDPETLMQNLQKALSFLKAEDYQQVELLTSVKGKSYVADADGGYWRMMSFIPDSITYNTSKNPEIAYEAGRILGRFHSLLGETDPADFKPVLPGFHDLNLRIQQFRQALKQGNGERPEHASKSIRTAENLLVATKTGDSQLPTRVCHNDTKLNNFLFSSKSGKALCLIDLDTVMEGHFQYDFGDAIRTIVNTAPEDERLLKRIHFSRPLFTAFVHGLSQEEGLLTRDEIKSLPRGAYLMPLLHGLRALTDYLNGDVYYQVSYPGQNLDRAVSLFTFAERALENREFMETVLSEYLE